MKKNNKGFTLAELLIVVAIIAVLVAVAIPVLTNQLENARESTDAANLRDAYAAATVAILQDDTSGVSAGPVAMTQTTNGFVSAVKDSKIGGIKLSTLTNAGKGSGGDAEFYVNVGTDGTITITSSATSGYKVVNPTTGAASATDDD